MISAPAASAPAAVLIGHNVHTRCTLCNIYFCTESARNLGQKLSEMLAAIRDAWHRSEPSCLSIPCTYEVSGTATESAVDEVLLGALRRGPRPLEKVIAQVVFGM